MVTRLELCCAVAGLATLWAACTVVEEPTDDEGRFGATSTVSTGTQGGGGSSAMNSGAGAAMNAVTTGQTSTVTGSSSSTVGSGGSCPDTSDEPNNSEQTATDLGSFDDCDEIGTTIKGVLPGNDVDWYTYDGTDKFGCIVEPTRSVISSAQVRICKFFDCKGISLTCPVNTSVDTSPDGHPGCCSVNGFTVAPDCDGFSDDATVYLRIDKPPSFPCVTYDLSLHY
jgi:hypothetical protein